MTLRQATLGTLTVLVLGVAIAGNPGAGETCDRDAVVTVRTVERTALAADAAGRALLAERTDRILVARRAAVLAETRALHRLQGLQELRSLKALPEFAPPAGRTFWRESDLPRLSEKYAAVPGVVWVERATLLIPEVIKAIKALLLGIEPVGYMRDLLA